MLLLVFIFGTKCNIGMLVSVEQGLPQFSKTEQILLVNNDVTLLCQAHKSHIEHLRSYELFPGLFPMTVHTMSELNDISSLFAYSVAGKLLLTPKQFILMH